MGYQRKKQSFYKEKDCFFLGYPKFFWPLLFWSGFKVLMKYEQPKIKRHAHQKFSLFLREGLRFLQASLFIFNRSCLAPALGKWNLNLLGFLSFIFILKQCVMQFWRTSYSKQMSDTTFFAVRLLIRKTISIYWKPIESWDNEWYEKSILLVWASSPVL